MNFSVALKNISKGKELTRNLNFTLKLEKGSIIRETTNGAKTIARVNSVDLLAEDWSCVKDS